MIVSREPIYTALKALLQGVTFVALSGGATTWAVPVSRRLKLWNEVPIQPACFIAAHQENDAYSSELTPSKTTISADLYVYTKTGDETVEQAVDLNLILDGIDTALKPSVLTGKQTLGGLVSHCRREGQVMLDPGDLDGQALAIIPIKIFVP
ncbi:hypothetical protein BjapCC829_21945 [Bradyrhizobium barranii]|uniref:DUF1254 domain-containing protein n=1 Tax=Bradyrhizobium barranii TaxID=2992140 RepID=A0ABY3QYF0_9BRAD|nr:hypothetical protein [Bradyrhizobium japonicum]UFW91053.1 hypothetical protein BjapCC829_21945 [Bradyrhizobium japonicum]